MSADPSLRERAHLLKCARCGVEYSSTLQACPACGAPRPGDSGFTPGDVIDGKYEVLALLGVGGMGEVFKVRHLRLDAVRTIKVMKRAFTSDESFKSRFLREAKLAAQVHHQNIAILHEFATLPDGTYYMVSEFIDGVTVRQWAKRNGRFPVGLAVDIVLQVLAGLDHCHRKGLLHRDISADNVMISLDSENRAIAKIIDLGIAKTLLDSGSEATQVGMFIGNPRYSSPEQLGSLPTGQEIDARADLYCLGVVLYEMIAGVIPFTADSSRGLMIKHLTEPPAPFSATVPEIELPHAFERAVLKALEKDRTKRYTSARDFAAALRPFAHLEESSTITANLGDLFKSARVRTTPPTLPGTLPAGGVVPQTMQQSVSAEEEQAWESAEDNDAIEAYESYLRAYPQGHWSSMANGRIKELGAAQAIADLEQRQDVSGLHRLVSDPHLGTANRKAARAARERVQRKIQEERTRREQEAWSRAEATGSVEDWTHYVESFGDSPRIEQARAALAEAASYERAASVNSVTGWSSYLSAWPQGIHSQTARQRLEQVRAAAAEQAFKKAGSDGTTGAFRNFLADFSDSPLAAEARRRLAEREAFKRAEAADSVEAWHAYLSEWPDSAGSGFARQRLAAAERQMSGAIREALTEGTSEALQRLVARYPAAAASMEVANALEEAGRLESALAGDRRQLEDFVARYPASTRLDIVRNRLAALEQADFNAAEKVASSVAWETFLSLWPAGRHAAAAGPRREAAKAEEAAAALRAAIKGDTVAAFEEFLHEYPDTDLTSEAHKRLQERIAYERASREDSLDGWEQYLERWPDATHSAPARRRLDSLRSEQKKRDAKKAKAAAAAAAATVAAQSVAGSGSPGGSSTEIAAAQPPPAAPEATAVLPVTVATPLPLAKTLSEPLPIADPVVTRTLPETIVTPAPSPRTLITPLPSIASPVEPVPFEEPDGTKKKRTAVIAAAVAAALIAIISLVGILARDRGTVATPTGYLAVDARPWAAIESVTDAEGKPWLAAKEQTPALLALPAGEYVVRLSNPEFPEPLSLKTTITASSTASLVGEFRTIEAVDYFAAAGWTQ